MDISIIHAKHLKHGLDHIDNRIQIILQIGKGAQINILLRATSHLTFQDLWALFLNLVDPEFIIDSQKNTLPINCILERLKPPLDFFKSRKGKTNTVLR